MRALIPVLFLAIGLSSCFKEDHVRPRIELFGPVTFSYNIDANYTDLGYKAIDNRDGDITRFVKVTGNVNPELPGLYQLYYNVRDAAGNPASEKHRLVYIKHHAGSIAGIYQAAGSCNGGVANFTVIEQATKTEIALENLLYLSDSITLTGYIRGVTGLGLVVNEYEHGDTVISGTGDINLSASQIDLQLIRQYNSQADTCHITLTR